MSNIALYGQTAYAHDWPVSAVPGTCPASGGAPTSPVWGLSALGATLRISEAMPVFRPQSALTEKNTTRNTALFGGVSGSPPTWDPV